MGRETDIETLEWLDRFAAGLGTKIVMPYRTSYDNMEDYDVIKDRILEIDRLYTEFAKWTRCNVLRVNVDDRNATRSYVNQVVDFLRPS